MQQKEPPKIEFPCEGYPIKVLGDNENNFHDFVIEMLRLHSEEQHIDFLSIKASESRNGKFVSVTVKIVAQSEQQLSDIHKAFMATGRVKMVM
ncbi:HP0495 family protein [Litoribacillus peritrichatus]|uniref:UPF0250 protein GCM10022277_18160 n=1 Tax=Litoribacillus peritrichatus TaxID=718191 RepID=A0ABP7MJQ7_9GAMM